LSSPASRSADPQSYLHPAYRADIDGLRAVAVLAVIAFHAFPSYIHGGFVGVDIFFVISGFLISTIVFRGLEEGRFRFTAFYARRIKRIFPALILVLAAFLALGATVLFAQEYRQLGKQSAASAAFISNFVSWAESGYFDTEAEVKPMLHLWSLAVEEQFYLVWPLLLFLLARTRLNLLWSTALIALGSFALNVGTVGEHASAAFYLPLTRMWELLAGALLAWIGLHHQARLDGALDRPVFGSRSMMPGIARRDALALAGIVALAVSIVWINRDRSFPGWAALLPVMGAFLVIGSGAGAWSNRILANRGMVLVGLVSYPLYLWHLPLLSFARIIGSGTPTVAIRCTAIALAFVLAYFTYRVVEKPIRSSRTGVIPLALLVLCAAVGGVGYAVYSNDGFASRFPADNTVSNNNMTFAAYEAKMLPCPDSLGGKDALSFCRLSADGDPSAAIFGDSHADHLFPGIAGVDRQRTWLLAGHTGCAPLAGVRSHLNGTREECLEKNDRILSILTSAKSISTVVLSANASYYISEGDSYTPLYVGTWSPKNWRLQAAVNPDPAVEKKTVFADGLDRTIDILEHAGKRVIVFIDVPGLPFLPFDCARRSTFGMVKPICSIDRSFVLQQQRDYREIVSKAHRDHPRILVFDPIETLCPKSACDTGQNASYYRDAHHLSLEGSRHLAEAFLAWLNVRKL